MDLSGRRQPRKRPDTPTPLTPLTNRPRRETTNDDLEPLMP